MRKWYPWLVVGLAFGFSAAVFSRLPDPIPTHWNVRGEIDGYTPRAWGAWIMPAILLTVALIVPRLPALDPRRENYEKFRPTYDFVVAAVVTLMAVLHVIVLGAGLGWPLRIERITPVLVGLLFVVIGNLMPRARPNWLFGIRTPWTLSNDRVWERTHRLGGYTFVLAGLVLIVTAFLDPALAMGAFIVAVVTASIVPIAYSYFAWKQETRRAPNT